MIYKFLETTDNGTKVYARIDDDGVCRLTCSEHDEQFKEWVAEGNTPEEAE